MEIQPSYRYLYLYCIKHDKCVYIYQPVEQDEGNGWFFSFRGSSFKYSCPGSLKCNFFPVYGKYFSKSGICLTEKRLEFPLTPEECKVEFSLKNYKKKIENSQMVDLEGNLIEDVNFKPAKID